MIHAQKYFELLQNIDNQQITEHSLRTPLQILFESLTPNGITVLHEGQRQGIFGTPDFKISNVAGAIGYCETKKVGENLKKIAKSVQIKKYLELTDNLLLTDYCSFIWIKRGIEVEHFSFCETNAVGDKNAKITSEKLTKLEELIQSFFRETPKGISTSKELAKALAIRTQILKHFLETELLQTEAAEKSPRLFGLFQTFQQTVSADLTPLEFADAYAQMLTFGLFLAKLNADNQVIKLNNARLFIPNSFELIRELTGFLEDLEAENYAPIRWVIVEILTILNNIELQAIRESLSFNREKLAVPPRPPKGGEKEIEFSQHSPPLGGLGGENDLSADPYLYFYEDFLGEYDAKLRKSKGVYYTPPAIVNFIVRAIDEVLKDKFLIKNGLADKDKVTVLDFATGTGTFILEIIKQILAQLPKNTPNRKVLIQEHILKNIFGFEYLIAPYTIAHLKLSQFLHENGYDLQAKERLQIFLTNTLEPLNAQVNFLLPALSKEGKTAQSIKNQPILVITGNPPYSGHSTNKGSWIAERVNEYKKVGNEVLKEKNPKWLQDDYVKFIRFAEWKMQQVKEGMVAIITNHSFLDNPTFRLMRKSLMTTFNQLYIIDLHGNAKKQEKTLEGEADQNVFDIQQGVSISIFIKKEGLERKIFHTDFYGKRKIKYDLCLNNDLNTIKWEILQPQFPHYLFVPQDITHKIEYEKGWSVKDIFHLNNIGVLTHRDAFLVDFSENTLKNRIKKFKSAEDARRVGEWFDLHDTRDWNIKTALNEMQNKDADIRLYAYRPFDNRYVCYNAELVERQRYELMQHFEKGENIAIVTGRAGQNVPVGLWNLAFITDKISDANLFYRGGACVFPLFYYNGNGNGANGNGYLFNEDGKKDNFSPEFRKFIKTKYFEKKDDTAELTFLIGKIKERITKSNAEIEENKLLGINGIEEIELTISKLKAQLSRKEQELEAAKNNPQNVAYNPEPLEVFYYIYAVLHSPNYRKQYEGFLKMDFPRVPFVEDLSVFRKLSQIGKEIADAHLLKTGEWEKLSVGQARGIDTNDVGDFKYKDGRLYYNKTQYFEEVSAEVWEFQIGGYTVLEKYLKDRKGKNIENELNHIQNIIKILTFSLEKGKEIDNLWTID